MDPLPSDTWCDAQPLTDHCFALLAFGKLSITGTVVREGSSSRLKFSTLVRMQTAWGKPSRFEWRPRFLAVR